MSDDGSDDNREKIQITISHRNTIHEYEFDKEDGEVMDLFTTIAGAIGIPLDNQKIIVPKLGLLKWPLKEPHQPVRDLAGKKLMLTGSMGDVSKAVQEMSGIMAKREERRQQQRRARKAAATTSRRGGISSTVEHTYTFRTIRALNNLPRPERSQILLERLSQDPGIVATMRKHEYVVGLLTEMEPLSNTESSHEGTSRILGLNRNHGEVIELRLRTDAYDGYRDYKTIRKTLCHELAHNIHSDHDRNFWDLCHQIEREVAKSDWKSGGHTIGETSAYHISGQDEVDDHADEGGWTGGEFVLGGVRDGGQGMSRRDILARAAMERQRKDDRAEQAADCGWRPCQKRSQKGSGDDEETSG